MNIGNFDTDRKILFIAEIGNNHEGDFELARRMISLAAQAGADAVKFQTFRTELFVGKSDPVRFHRLKSFELTDEQFAALSRTAKDEGLLFLSTPLDMESAVFLKEIVDAYKIASGDNNFFPLLEYVAQTGLPVIMSTGIADLTEIKTSVDAIQTVWQAKHIRQDLALLHCITGYPVPSSQANVSALRQLQKSFDCTVGYSDHTLGITASLLAVALGARIIEKHFTVDKNKSDFRDHQLSADPDELRALVSKSEEILTLLGTGEKKPQTVEMDIKDAVRRSIVAGRDLSAGTVIGMNDLLWIRPGSGLAPGRESLLLGKKLAVPVEAGHPILPQHLAND